MTNEKPQERKRLTKEEIAERKAFREAALERRITLAKERDARVLNITSYDGNIISHILQQFDRISRAFKDRLGKKSERGVPFEVGIPMIDEASKLIFAFSELTERMAKEIGFYYSVPEEVSYWKKQEEQEDGDVVTDKN